MEISLDTCLGEVYLYVVFCLVAPCRHADCSQTLWAIKNYGLVHTLSKLDASYCNSVPEHPICLCTALATYLRPLPLG